jgi:nicotinamide-nucleotide amidase
VDVRLTGRGEQAESLVTQSSEIVRKTLSSSIYSEADEPLEAVVVRLLSEQGKTLAIAESCTGGLISHRVTNVPGASQVLLSGAVTYANTAKEQVLGVPPEMLGEHGAVSEPVAQAMAQGARHMRGADMAIAVTGIAGPGGGSPDKPVGTVFIALATATGSKVLSRRNDWDRPTFKQVTSQQALELVRRQLMQLPLE